MRVFVVTLANVVNGLGGATDVEILVESAAERDVDQLHAAANAEHGLAELGERAQQVQLEAITYAVGCAHGRRWLLAIETGIDVGTSLQEEAVQRRCIVVDGKIPATNLPALLD